MRPPFLTSPGTYVRTQRMRQEPADANPFRKFDKPDRIVLKACLWAVVAIAALVVLRLL